jgi:hypothetical protein
MAVLTCPRDHTPLDGRGGIYDCRRCGSEYVVSITDAWSAHAGWNRNAPGAGAVIAVMEATATPTERKAYA